MSNKKVLNYHDVLLYAEDIELLITPQWLNDQASCRQRIHRHLFCLSCLDPSKQDMTGLSFATADHSILVRVSESREV